MSKTYDEEEIIVEWWSQWERYQVYSERIIFRKERNGSLIFEEREIVIKMWKMIKV